MKKIELENLVPALKSAVTDLTTDQEYANWASPFITKVASICLPDHQVTITKIQNP